MSFDYTSLMVSFVLGCIGWAYWSYGGKRSNMLIRACGALLMIFPYFVSNLAGMIIMGLVIMALPWAVTKFF